MTRQVSIRFTDNQTGTGADVEVNVESQDQSLSTLLANTVDAKDGYLTSAELQGQFQGVTLIVKANGKQIGEAKGSGNNECNFARTPISQLSITLTA